MAKRRVGDMTPKEEKAVRKLEERYGSVSLKPSDAIPSPLYHYTSSGGLVGIVSSGVLRASNFSYLNDSTEIQEKLWGQACNVATLKHPSLLSSCIRHNCNIASLTPNYPNYNVRWCE